MNRTFSTIGILVALSLIGGALRAKDQQKAASPSVESTEIKELIDGAEKDLASNKSDVSAVLSDPKYLPAHAWPRSREVIKRHAQTKVTMVTAQEPGEWIRVRVRLVEADGSASAGALVYLYHTNERGDYGPNDANIPLAVSDNEYARLFCYAVTDADGAIEVQTIRPAGYPDTTIPSHIHIRITTRNGKSDGAEIWFEDDPRIDREAREEAARHSSIVICPVAKGADNQRSVDAKIKLD